MNDTSSYTNTKAFINKKKSLLAMAHSAYCLNNLVSNFLFI